MMRESIFISYRRTDSAPDSQRLARHLDGRFGQGATFLDAQSIDPGSAFPDRIVEGIRRAQVVVVLIGPTWLAATDEHSRRRIDDPADYVHREVALALHDKKLIVPVLVGGATMPPAAGLPEPLQALAPLQAVVLGRADDDEGLNRLTALIGRIATEPDAGVPRSHRCRQSLASAVVLLASMRSRPTTDLTDRHQLAEIAAVTASDIARLDECSAPLLVNMRPSPREVIFDLLSMVTTPNLGLEPSGTQAEPGEVHGDADLDALWTAYSRFEAQEFNRPTAATGAPGPYTSNDNGRSQPRFDWSQLEQDVETSSGLDREVRSAMLTIEAPALVDGIAALSVAIEIRRSAASPEPAILVKDPSFPVNPILPDLLRVAEDVAAAVGAALCPIEDDASGDGGRAYELTLIGCPAGARLDAQNLGLAIAVRMTAMELDVPAPLALPVGKVGRDGSVELPDLNELEALRTVGPIGLPGIDGPVASLTEVLTAVFGLDFTQRVRSNVIARLETRGLSVEWIDSPPPTELTVGSVSVSIEFPQVAHLRRSALRRQGGLSVIAGPSGSGRTVISRQLAKELRPHGWRACGLSVADSVRITPSGLMNVLDEVKVAIAPGDSPTLVVLDEVSWSDAMDFEDVSELGALASLCETARIHLLLVVASNDATSWDLHRFDVVPAVTQAVQVVPAVTDALDRIADHDVVERFVLAWRHASGRLWHLSDALDGAETLNDAIERLHAPSPMTSLSTSDADGLARVAALSLFGLTAPHAFAQLDAATVSLPVAETRFGLRMLSRGDLRRALDQRDPLQLLAAYFIALSADGDPRLAALLRKVGSTNPSASRAMLSGLANEFDGWMGNLAVPCLPKLELARIRADFNVRGAGDFDAGVRAFCIESTRVPPSELARTLDLFRQLRPAIGEAEAGERGWLQVLERLPEVLERSLGGRSSAGARRDLLVSLFRLSDKDVDDLVTRTVVRFLDDEPLDDARGTIELALEIDRRIRWMSGAEHALGARTVIDANIDHLIDLYQSAPFRADALVMYLTLRAEANGSDWSGLIDQYEERLRSSLHRCSLLSIASAFQSAARFNRPFATRLLSRHSLFNGLAIMLESAPFADVAVFLAATRQLNGRAARSLLYEPSGGVRVNVARRMAARIQTSLDARGAGMILAQTAAIDDSFGELGSGYSTVLAKELGTNFLEAVLAYENRSSVVFHLVRGYVSSDSPDLTDHTIQGIVRFYLSTLRSTFRPWPLRGLLEALTLSHSDDVVLEALHCGLNTFELVNTAVKAPTIDGRSAAISLAAAINPNQYVVSDKIHLPPAPIGLLDRGRSSVAAQWLTVAARIVALQGRDRPDWTPQIRATANPALATRIYEATETLAHLRSVDILLARELAHESRTHLLRLARMNSFRIDEILALLETIRRIDPALAADIAEELRGEEHFVREVHREVQFVQDGRVQGELVRRLERSGLGFSGEDQERLVDLLGSRLLETSSPGAVYSILAAVTALNSNNLDRLFGAVRWSAVSARLAHCSQVDLERLPSLLCWLDWFGRHDTIRSALSAVRPALTGERTVRSLSSVVALAHLARVHASSDFEAARAVLECELSTPRRWRLADERTASEELGWAGYSVRSLGGRVELPIVPVVLSRIRDPIDAIWCGSWISGPTERAVAQLVRDFGAASGHHLLNQVDIARLAVCALTMPDLPREMLTDRFDALEGVAAPIVANLALSLTTSRIPLPAWLEREVRHLRALPTMEGFRCRHQPDAPRVA